MVKLWALCTNYSFYKIFQSVIISFILFFIIAKPVIEIVLDMVVYELCEIYEDDEMEEQEEQKKELEFHNSKGVTYVSSTNTLVHPSTENSLFSRLNYIREFYLEIPSPPPKQA